MQFLKQKTATIKSFTVGNPSDQRASGSDLAALSVQRLAINSFVRHFLSCTDSGMTTHSFSSTNESHQAHHHNHHSHHHQHHHKDGNKHWDVTFSFSGGGWFQMYHFGVCKAIQDSGMLEQLQQEGKTVRFCGTSAGALAAAKIASGSNLYDEMKEYAVKCATDYRRTYFPRLLALRHYVMDGIEECAKKLGGEEHQAKVRDSLKDGRLEVYTTTLPHMRTKILSEFKDREGLAEALCASCNIVPLFGMPFRLRLTGHEWVCDGGLTTFQPRRHEARTITVTPFYFRRASISPSRELRPWRALYPPRGDILLAYFDHGYNDALAFLAKSGHISTDKSQSLRRQVPEHMEERWIVALEKVLLFFLYVALKPLLMVLMYQELALYLLAQLFARHDTGLTLMAGIKAMLSLETVRYALWNTPTCEKPLLEKASPRYHDLLKKLGFLLPECLEANRSCLASFFSSRPAQ